VSIIVKVDERRTSKDAWGQAIVRVEFPPSSASHAEKVKDAAQRCLDILEEAVTGQKPLPMDGEVRKPVAAKGQTKIPGTGKKSRPVAHP